MIIIKVKLFLFYFLLMLFKYSNQNDTSFFEVLSRIQSNRLDDQRCSFRLLPSTDKSKFFKLIYSIFMVNNKFYFFAFKIEIINMNANGNAINNNNNSKNSFISNTLLKEDSSIPSDDFFDLIMKSQVNNKMIIIEILFYI